MDNEQVRVCRCCGEAETHRDGCEEMRRTDPLHDPRRVWGRQKAEMPAAVAARMREVYAEKAAKSAVNSVPAIRCRGCGAAPGEKHSLDCGDFWSSTKHLKVPPADPWAHRSAGMRCRTCMWYVAKALGRTLDPYGGPDRPVGDGVIGRCRRHAPALQGFPVVLESDWCGDHKLSEEAVR